MFCFVFVDKLLARGRVLSVGAVFMASSQPTIFEISDTDADAVFMELQRFITYTGGSGSRVFVVNAQSVHSLEAIADRLGLSSLPTELPLSKTQLAKLQRAEYQDAVFGDCMDPRTVSVATATFDKHPLGRTALVALLQNCMETRVKLPTVFDSAGKLVLEGSALQQLHIDDLIKTLDRTKTAAGGRIFAERLRNPFANEDDILRAQAELSEALLDERLLECATILKGILDVDRIAKTMADPDAKRAKSFIGSAVKTFDKINDLYAVFGKESPVQTLPEKLRDAADEGLTEIAKEFSTSLENASRFVAQIDFRLALVELVRDGYTVPELGTGISIRGLRHPVVEIALGREPFIANDADELPKILYSYNGTGKTTYMRSIGAAIVLAQAGFPVPAERMEFRPIRKLFTRLVHRDMLGRGLSTFEVDALELAHIVSRAGPDTVVLAEEVVSSDALSNAVLSIGFMRELVAKQAIVLMSTHSPDVVDEFKDICWHFPVRFVGSAFVFERTLVRGAPASRSYGLEMAAALGVNPKLLVRPSSLAELKKSSRYNSRLVVDHCAVCGDRATQTHHIRQQKDFARGDRSKNQLSNLAPLCDRCHDRVHHGDLRIDGYRKTSEGVKLVFAQSERAELEDPPELM
jgi:DNA mismatch repair ATPase MutS